MHYVFTDGKSQEDFEFELTSVAGCVWGADAEESTVFGVLFLSSFFFFDFLVCGSVGTEPVNPMFLDSSAKDASQSRAGGCAGRLLPEAVAGVSVEVPFLLTTPVAPAV